MVALGRAGRWGRGAILTQEGLRIPPAALQHVIATFSLPSPSGLS